MGTSDEDTGMLVGKMQWPDPGIRGEDAPARHGSRAGALHRQHLDLPHHRGTLAIADGALRNQHMHPLRTLPRYALPLALTTILAPALAQPLNGTVEQHNFVGPVTGKTVLYNIYLPAGY